MPAPFPYEAAAGVSRDAIESEAVNLFVNYMWVARLVDEMNSESVLDNKRAMQFVAHARQMRRWYEILQARIGASHTQVQIADVIEAMFAVKKCRWASRAAMNADLQAIYAASGTVADWIEANAGDYKQGYSINKEISPGVMTDEPIKVAKPAGVTSRLFDFRALFATNTVAAARKG